MVVGYIYGHYEPGKTFYLGGLVALLGFVNQFTGAFFRIATAYTDIVTYYTDVQSVLPIQEDYRRMRRHQEPRPLPAEWREIHVRHLAFRFKDAKGLHDVHLQLRKGQRIALIGESGSGKSTLLALLRGLHDPLPRVELTVDGSPAYNWEGLSDAVTLFPQEPEIFENTVFYNITMGLPFTEAEVLAACDLVCFTEVVRQLPLGLQTVIQEKGVNLSVGQKQRLALARGVLASRSSTILLLDEPTSSMDAQTGIQIYRRLLNGFPDKVIMSSLHHLDLLCLFDYVYVLGAGRIIEEGTYEAYSKGDYVKRAKAPLVS
jgi:ABC-type bacteriocin/lantibiotic exporter with double-glycine peptidase domain